MSRYEISIQNDIGQPITEQELVHYFDQKEYCISLQMQQQIIKYIQSAFQLQKIRVSSYENKNFNNGNCHINFDTLKISHIELQKFNGLFVKFEYCDIKNLYLSQSDIHYVKNENIYKSYNFNCFKCDIQQIDCSNCDIKAFEMEYNIIKNIVFNQQSRMQLCGEIVNIKFLSCDYLEEINIYCDTFQNIYVNDSNESFIDLSKFTKLKVVNIHCVYHNILLPEKLDILSLSAKSHYSSKRQKVLNTNISSKLLSLTTFDLEKGQVLDYEKLSLCGCCIDFLLLMEDQDFTQLEGNYIKELVLQSKSKEIDLSNNSVDVLTLQSRNIEKLKIYHLDEVNFQDKTQQQQIIISEYSDAINLTELIELKELQLVIHEYFKSFREYIQIPFQLQSISLTQKCKLQNQQKTHFNFSSFTNLQNIKLKGFKIRAILMFQHRMKLIFNCKYDTDINIQCSKLVGNSQASLEEYLKKINYLQIVGLKCLIIDEKEQKVLDFQQFQSLLYLKLKNVEKLVLLPKSLKQFEIINDQMIETLQNLELYKFTQLEELQIRNCLVDNLIVGSNVQVKCSYCKVNYLHAEIFKQLQYNEIKTFQQQPQNENLNLKQNGNTLHTLSIRNHSILQSVNLQGLNHMLSELWRDPKIFDFTQFPVLKEVILTNVNCQGIIFGESQQKILIERDSKLCLNNNRIEFLDFQNCKKQQDTRLQHFKVINYEICELFLGKCDSIFNSKCKFKYVVQNNNHNCELMTNYNYKYAVSYKNGTKQRILNKFGHVESEFFISKSELLERKLDYLYRLINCIINE